MKSLKIFITIIIILGFSFNSHSQEGHAKKQELVMSFLNYINQPNWKFDTLAKKYLLFRSDESARFSKDERKLMISFAVAYLSTEVQNIRFNDLIIKPYSEADSVMKSMFIRPETKEKTYVVYTKNRRFRRYFLLEDNKILGFVTTKRHRGFVLLN